MAQISIEDAFPIFRERCRELADENLLLRAQVAALERRNEELEQLAAGRSDAPTPGPHMAGSESQPPASGGTDQ